MRASTNDPRVHLLNDKPDARGDYVLYWMQASQRAHQNPALEFAVAQANRLALPCVVVFGLMDDYPEANLRHYRFMLEGLAQAAEDLQQRNIPFVLRRGHPERIARELAEDAALLVCDVGYLRHQKAWRHDIAEAVRCPVYEVEADVIVPVALASPKREWAARTLRKRIAHAANEFLRLSSAEPLPATAGALHLRSEDPSRIEALLASLKLDESVTPVDEFFTGGTHAAQNQFRKFLKSHFDAYTDNRNQPQTNHVSHMSKYLHFGQISPIWLAVEAQLAGTQRDYQTYIEELLVRRELAINFVHYTSNYDRFDCLPDWARATLHKHADDPRSPAYTREQLERAQTHDPYWNAAMDEMRHTGYMHNYMRMYWGKKVLEWSPSPEEAHATLLFLNNRYFLDGRDPVSYANVNWIFGLHDRPWQERPIFGTVRYMAASGLERKCDIEAYVEKVAWLKQRNAAAHRTRDKTITGDSST